MRRRSGLPVLYSTEMPIRCVTAIPRQVSDLMSHELFLYRVDALSITCTLLPHFYHKFKFFYRLSLVPLYPSTPASTSQSDSTSKTCLRINTPTHHRHYAPMRYCTKLQMRHRSFKPMHHHSIMPSRYHALKTKCYHVNAPKTHCVLRKCILCKIDLHKSALRASAFWKCDTAQLHQWMFGRMLYRADAPSPQFADAPKRQRGCSVKTSSLKCPFSLSLKRSPSHAATGARLRHALLPSLLTSSSVHACTPFTRPFTHGHRLACEHVLVR